MLKNRKVYHSFTIKNIMLDLIVTIVKQPSIVLPILQELIISSVSILLLVIGIYIYHSYNVSFLSKTFILIDFTTDNCWYDSSSICNEFHKVFHNTPNIHILQIN